MRAVKPYSDWTTLEHEAAKSNLSNSLLSKLLGRSLNAVEKYRSRNGLLRDSNKWEPHEDLLLNYYPMLGIKDFIGLLPGKNKAQINHRLIVRGFIERGTESDVWTDEDNKLLRGLDRTVLTNRAYLRILFNKPRTYVFRKLELLGLKRPDIRLELAPLVKAKILRAVLSGQDLEDLLIELVSIPTFVVRKYYHQYRNEMGLVEKKDDFV